MEPLDKKTDTAENPETTGQAVRRYFLRWRILARIRRFLRPTLRRPLPVFFVPTRISVNLFVYTRRHQLDANHQFTEAGLPGQEGIIAIQRPRRPATSCSKREWATNSALANQFPTFRPGTIPVPGYRYERAPEPPERCKAAPTRPTPAATAPSVSPRTGRCPSP